MRIYSSKHLHPAPSNVGQTNITPASIRYFLDEEQIFHHTPETFRYDDLFVQHDMSNVLRVMTRHERTQDMTKGQIHA